MDFNFVGLKRHPFDQFSAFRSALIFYMKFAFASAVKQKFSRLE